MRRFMVLLIIAAGCASEGPDGKRQYANSDPQLAVGNAALNTCSCIFVMNMPEDFCSAWVKASPAVARVGIDRDAKTVESSAFVSWSARARWVDEKRGCVLE